MIGVATSDLHLGFTGPGRIIGGRNGREIDVELAWHHAVERIVDAQPDLVTIAGDVFHSTRPSFHAVRAFQDGIRRIITETNAQVVVILGNHESPRTAAALSPVIVADGEPRVRVVTVPTVLRLRVHGGETVAVTCFPFNALTPDLSYQVDPAPGVDINVLLIHAAVRSSTVPQALPHFYGSQGIDVGREADRWDVIACGDYHEFTRLVPPASERIAFYSGAIERTSSNIWQEREPKGVVWYDTTARADLLLEIPTRPVHSYVYDTETLSAESINQQLQLIAHAPASKDTLLRVVAICARGDRDGIDWRLVRELKQRAFHFALSIEWVDVESTELSYQDRRRRTLADDARDFFAGEDQRIRACAFNYLGLSEKLAA